MRRRMAAAETRLHIRPFALADAAAVEPWLAAPGLFVPPGAGGGVWAARLLAAPGVEALVAASPQRPVGFARLAQSPDGVAELTLAVAPAARRAGVGSALLAAALARARQCGAHAVDAAIDVANGPALAFFVGHGFERERRVGDHLVLRRLLHAVDGARPLDIG